MQNAQVLFYFDFFHSFLLFCSVSFRFFFFYMLFVVSLSLYTHTRKVSTPPPTHPFKLIQFLEEVERGLGKKCKQLQLRVLVMSLTMPASWWLSAQICWQGTEAGDVRRIREAQAGQAGEGRGKDRWMKAEAEAEAEAVAVKGTKAATTVKSDGNWLKSKEKKQPNYGIKIYIQTYICMCVYTLTRLSCCLPACHALRATEP